MGIILHACSWSRNWFCSRISKNNFIIFSLLRPIEEDCSSFCTWKTKQWFEFKELCLASDHFHQGEVNKQIWNIIYICEIKHDRFNGICPCWVHGKPKVMNVQICQNTLWAVGNPWILIWNSPSAYPIIPAILVIIPSKAVLQVWQLAFFLYLLHKRFWKYRLLKCQNWCVEHGNCVWTEPTFGYHVDNSIFYRPAQ